jgi:hypothetical protein
VGLEGELEGNVIGVGLFGVVLGLMVVLVLVLIIVGI